LKPLKAAKIRFIEGDDGQVVNVSNCGDLPLGEGWSLTSRNETRSFARVPLRGRLVIGEDGNRRQNDFFQVSFYDFAPAR